MSHVATNWAFAQRGLKPAQKLVLLCLADRHNPDHGGCWPSQSRLAEDAEVSRSQLNVHLQALTDLGLIRRETRYDEKTHRQRSTFYVLGFEDGFVAADGGGESEGGDGGSGTEQEHSGEPCPETGHGAVSDFGGEPCPENGESRVRKSDTNFVKEPIRKTRKARAREGAPARGACPEFDQFVSAHPSAQDVNAVFREWTAAVDAGADPARLVVLAHRYSAAPEVQRGYAKKAQNWLADGAWQERDQPASKGEPSLDEMARFWADRIISEKFVSPSAVSAGLAQRMLALGLVSAAQLRDRGIWL